MMGYSTVKTSICRLLIGIVMALLLVVGMAAALTVSAKATQGTPRTALHLKLDATPNPPGAMARPLSQVVSKQQWVCEGSGVGRTCTYTWWNGSRYVTKTCVNNYDTYYQQYYWNCSTS